MTRIIAGEFGGRRLSVPPRGTRPTTDRVREALFSRLDAVDALRGARVADLFAGSGALGLEALSRGARDAVLVESAAPAARVLTGNVRELGVAARTQVVREKVQPYLERSTATWDLVLIDPPYDLGAPAVSEVLRALSPRIGPDAWVVLEASTRAERPTLPGNLESVSEKDYGETRLTYLRPVPGDDQVG